MAQFVAKLKSVSRSKDKKLELLQDIAHESGIEWNSKALEQQLYKPPAVEQPPSVKQVIFCTSFAPIIKLISPALGPLIGKNWNNKTKTVLLHVE